MVSGVWWDPEAEGYVWCDVCGPNVERMDAWDEWRQMKKMIG